MFFKHLFKVALNWVAADKNTNSKFITKNHRIHIDNKADLKMSAAKAFKGDPTLYNPEDLLLSALTSCHMMSYLYCCQQNNVEVISYSDNSEAYLEVESNGSGKIVKVILYPRVKLANSDQTDLALSLHKKANELCFIANSCNFEIVHQASCI